jgi:hypothetical protein
MPDVWLSASAVAAELAALEKVANAILKLHTWPSPVKVKKLETPEKEGLRSETRFCVLGLSRDVS